MNAATPAQILDWDLGDSVPGLEMMLNLCHTMRYWLSLDKKELCVVLFVNEYQDVSRTKNMALSGRESPPLHGYLAHKNQDHHKPYCRVVGGGQFPMSEVLLHVRECFAKENLMPGKGQLNQI